MRYDDFSPINLNDLFNAENWQDKYKLILGWSDCISSKPALHTPENYLQGCEVASWIKTIYTEEGQRFSFDSQSKLIKGLAGVILVQLDKQSPDFIRNWDEKHFLEKSQLQKYMTPSRNNGLMSLIRYCKQVG